MSGTAFFMRLTGNATTDYFMLFTNKHVVDGSTSVRVTCHIGKDGRPTGSFVDCAIDTTGDFVIRHSDPSIDLCGVFFAPTIHEVRQKGMDIFMTTLTTDLFPKDDEWEDFDAIEEVTMIGCPNGIYDTFNNFPIARRGSTATALGRLYNGRPEFMVDMACFPGSSGSPIFLYDRNGFIDKRTNTYRLGEQRIRFVGVLHAGPKINNAGMIVMSKTPSVSVGTMMHLGYAIRSSKILDLHQDIRRLYPF